MSDKLEEMWAQQEEFTELLHTHRAFPKLPVDTSTKEGQLFLKHIANECVYEIFEAVQLLRNSKTHRATDVNQFDRESYIEELIDAQHYLLEIAIASGISCDEFYEAFIRKGKVNEDRINEGY